MIRISPDIGGLDPEILTSSGASQVVVAQNVVHWSGLVAARSGPEGISFPATDMSGQLSFILGRLDECLSAAGTDRTRIIMLTMFATTLEGMGAALKTVYAPWVGEHRPTVTCIGVNSLAFAETLLEVQGCALLAD